MRVYVAGPYTRGDVGYNVHCAMTAGHHLMNLGHHPYVPHLSHFMHIRHWRTYEQWMALDLAWLEVSEALIRLPGDSPGADKEVCFANKHDIPCFSSVLQFADAQQKESNDEPTSPQAG